MRASTEEPTGSHPVTMLTRLVPNSVRRLLPMVGSRGLDQVAQGVCSLAIARWVGTAGFAPFATIFIVYALAGHIGDSGLLLAILRTPAGRRIRTASAGLRVLANGCIAVAFIISGLIVAGSTGIVLGFTGAALFLAPLAFCGRGILQWEGKTRRLAWAEGSGALLLLFGTLLFVRSEADLLLFAGLFCAKQIVEIAIQGLPTGVFAADGDRPAFGMVWTGQVMTYLTANVDYVLVAWTLGDEAMSIYAIGFRLASAFSSIVSAPLLRGAFVDLANSDRPQLEMDRLMKQVLYFGVIGIAGTTIVAFGLPTVLGDEWALTRSLTILLGLALPWRLLLGPVLALAMTRNKARSVLVWELARMVAMAASVLAFSTSLVAAAAAAASANILSVTWSYLRACTGVGVRPSAALQSAAFVSVAVSVALATNL